VAPDGAGAYFPTLLARTGGGESAQEGRSWESLLLHRLGEASAHASAGLIAAGAVLAWVVVGAVVRFAVW
jgi:hypothetical protein